MAPTINYVDLQRIRIFFPFRKTAVAEGKYHRLVTLVIRRMESPKH